MRLAILLAVFLAIPTFCLAQTTRYVPDDFATIQGAIHGSNHGDTIIVRPGTYFENLDYLGKAITLVSESGPDVTVIDGNQISSVVVFVTHEIQNSVLDGFTITNGVGSIPSGSLVRGGGIFCADTSPTVTRCIITGNEAMRGGGIYSRDGVMHIIQCIISDNQSAYGGGLENYYASPTVRDCTFIDNYASSDGGGIYNDSHCSPNVSNCLFINNEAEVKGGCFYNDYFSSPKLFNCILSSNRATKGGGMYNNAANPELTNCTLSENRGDWVGGIKNVYDSHPKLTNCILWNNKPVEMKHDANSETVLRYSCIRSFYPGDFNIYTDPLFADPDNHDLRLTRYSPCINRGTNVDAPPVDFDYDARPTMGSVDMGMDEFTDIHTLAAGSFSVSQASGGNIPFTLEAGAAHGGSWYAMFGSLSGTVPGTPLPGGGGTLPINYDGLTINVMNLLNTPLFTNFLGLLNGAGNGSATLNVAPGRIPLGWVGKTMYYAYTLDSFAMASNPIAVQVVP